MNHLSNILSEMTSVLPNICKNDKCKILEKVIHHKYKIYSKYKFPKVTTNQKLVKSSQNCFIKNLRDGL